VKGTKVLRTRKVRWYQSGVENKWNYFCGNTCLHDYINEHLQAFIRIAPRREPLETPSRLRKSNTPQKNIIGELDPHILKQL
jgi:glucose-6-phosphate 1-dehydrogenase